MKVLLIRCWWLSNSESESRIGLALLLCLTTNTEKLNTTQLDLIAASLVNMHSGVVDRTGLLLMRRALA